MSGLFGWAKLRVPSESASFGWAGFAHIYLCRDLDFSAQVLALIRWNYGLVVL